MAALAANKSYLVVTCQANAIVLNTLDPDKNVVLEPPNLSGEIADNVVDDGSRNDGQDTKPDKARVDTPAAVVLAALSSCSSWLVLCSNNKQLSLWKTSDWSLVSNRCVVRSASAVTFTPSGQYIVLADKSGDAYTYSVKNPDEKGMLILGHVSMLLDVLVTPDEKYVITCDRDEKIRVSNFPNSYNIMTYCLGHEEFVSKIGFLPHNTSILVSSSGDGTVKFWEYERGNCIHTIECWQDVKHKGGEVSKVLPVKSFTSCQLSGSESIVCVNITVERLLSVYQVNTKDEKVLSSNHLQNISLELEPWDVIVTEEKLLWILSPNLEDIIFVYGFSKPSGQFVLNHGLSVKTALGVAFVKERTKLFSGIEPPQSLSVYYKRQYDNLQKYHERKKVRIMGSSATKPDVSKTN